MSVKMLGWAWDQVAAPLTKFVLVTLADYANNEGGCWPSIGRIAERTCMSERTVQRAVADLEAAGVLVRKKPDKEGRIWFWLKHDLPTVAPVPKTANETAPQWLRDEVLRDANCTCYWCERVGDQVTDPDGFRWTMDRYVAGRRGGKYERGNVVLACRKCNTSKGARKAEEFAKSIGKRGDSQSPVEKTGVTASQKTGDAQSPKPSDEPSVDSFTLESEPAHRVTGAEIYKAYPRHVAPDDAMKAIAKAAKKKPMAILLERTIAYAAAMKKAGTEKQFIPYPATWFNAGRYDDDPAEWLAGVAEPPQNTNTNPITKKSALL